VEVKKDGFTAVGEEVQLQDGKRRVLTACLVHPAAKPNTTLPERAEKVLAPPSGEKNSIQTGESARNRNAAQGRAAEENWIREVGALPPDQQVAAVAEKLRQCNPGFDGQVRPKIENGSLVELSFPTDTVADLSPLRALPTLRRLYLTTPSVQGKVTDLSPLHGLSLTHLSIHGSARLHDLRPLQGMKLVWLDAMRCPLLKDLTPLQGMPLSYLGLWQTNQVTDLSPLRGMPLTGLDLNSCIHIEDLTPLHGMKLVGLHLTACGKVKDLTPLQGMPLAFLSLWGCGGVRDLTPLHGMPLTGLDLEHTQQIRSLAPLQGMKLTRLSLTGCAWVTDLSPLRGMPLTRLSLYGCNQLRDLTPLRGMPLQILTLSPRRISKGIEIVRRMKSLKKIGMHWDEKQLLPPQEFWKRYDAGDFKP
jgi:internalin A